jgi:hypothetical protein
LSEWKTITPFAGGGGGGAVTAGVGCTGVPARVGGKVIVGRGVAVGGSVGVAVAAGVGVGRTRVAVGDGAVVAAGGTLVGDGLGVGVGGALHAIAVTAKTASKTRSRTRFINWLLSFESQEKTAEPTRSLCARVSAVNRFMLIQSACEI